MKFKRVFLIVLDSFGVGELPDSADFGDEGSDTLGAVYSSGRLNVPNMKELGLFNIEGVRADRPVKFPKGACGRSGELSRGKDTTVGHWEIAGAISDKPLPTYPNGFPTEILDRLEKETGFGWICNKPYSGTQLLLDYGREQKETGKLIVYTSGDSVFQVAAHMEQFTLEQLYDYCEKARKILVGEHSVGRVIARPYVGEYPNYTRTSDRHDYSLECPKTTMLDVLKDGGFETLSVGKISDIFAGRGVTKSVKTSSNTDGMAKSLALADDDFTGLCFINLVDFDSKYGHRNDSVGYAEALNEFDAWLPSFKEKLNDDDLLIITADHGCDPLTPSTDHSREYVPILCYANKLVPINLGTRTTYSDIAATVCENFGVDTLEGNSFLKSLMISSPDALINAAKEAQKASFAPYSNYNVGAALLCADGKVYNGANVESAAYSPTTCAERTALTKAVSEGETELSAIAVVGGPDGKVVGGCTPCGVCRQFLYELGGKDLPVITLDAENNTVVRRMEELLPDGFSGKQLGK